MRHWRITGNSKVAIKTGSTYISHSMIDITAISTANLGFSTTPSAARLTPGDCSNDRQLEIAISQFLAVGRCRNDLSNPLLSSTSSKIPNLAFELKCYLSDCHRSRCNYFQFWGPYHFPVVRYCCTYLPTLFYTCTWSYSPISLKF